MQTRERLIEAAQRLFVKHGFGGASIRDIAEEAGYSQGAFYSNFSGKEDVLLEILSRYKAREMQQFTVMLDAADIERDDVLARLDSWAASLNHDANWSMLAVELQLHANRNPAFAVEYEAMWQQHRDELGSLIDRLFKQMGLIPQADTGEMAAGFMALAHGLALQRVDARPDQSGLLIMVFLRGLIAGAKRQADTK